jgi:protein TonB
VISKSLLRILGIGLFLALFFMIACQSQVRRKGAGDTVSDVENADSSRAPVIVKNVDPEYPEQASREGVEGVVWLKVVIDSTGKVTDATVTVDSGKDVGFEEAALEAARKTKWKPALEKGKPISTYVTYKIEFAIK